MFMLTLSDEDISQNIGVFDTEAQILDFLEKVPSIHTDFDGNYAIEKNAMTPVINVTWKEAIVPLTVYTFSGIINPYFSWQKISHLPTHYGLTESQTMIDNYIYDNSEVEQEVLLRESLKKALQNHFQRKGKEVDFGGRGSQDGEYLLIDSQFYMHIDPIEIRLWKQNKNLTDILSNYE